ncbi:MAG TPA: hypothetical protein VEY95_12060 [Azospirillaceae bacterium]|nr:hypothetical protein [Azospirillaceae bacterium]
MRRLADWMLIIAFATCAASAPAAAQNARAISRYAYTYRCGEERFQRYIDARTREDAVARMAWLDRGGCRIESFSREGEPKNLWPEIKRSLSDPATPGGRK